MEGSSGQLLFLTILTVSGLLVYTVLSSIFLTHCGVKEDLKRHSIQLALIFTPIHIISLYILGPLAAMTFLAMAMFWQMKTHLNIVLLKQVEGTVLIGGFGFFVTTGLAGITALNLVTHQII